MKGISDHANFSESEHTILMSSRPQDNGQSSSSIRPPLDIQKADWTETIISGANPIGSFSLNLFILNRLRNKL